MDIILRTFVLPGYCFPVTAEIVHRVAYVVSREHVCVLMMSCAVITELFSSNPSIMPKQRTIKSIIPSRVENVATVYET